MSLRAAIHHKTRYVYDRAVEVAPHVVRLRPAPHCRTGISAYSLRILPAEHFINWQQDPFGNFQARIVFPKPSAELLFEVDLVAEMTVSNPFDFFLEESAFGFPLLYGAALERDLAPYLQASPGGRRLSAFVEEARCKIATSGRRTVDVLVELNRMVRGALRYDIRMEPGVFAPDETLERGHGSCRDFAWLLVQLMRRLGLASRFVSGYSVQLRPDDKPLSGPVGVAKDMVDLHAWAEVFLPGAGWVGLDPTSALLAGEGHIPLACTPDPETAAPITGSFSYKKLHELDRVTEDFSFTMTVTRVAETPRTTLPYEPEVWSRIDALGRRVDEALSSGDVRLTIGGEPTFVAADDPEGAEWNVAADGPTKRRYAGDLLWRLYDRFTPHGLVHEGQGKWYPGEPLPRWALSSYFRKDGIPIWNDANLFAKEDRGSAHAPEALQFITALARALGVDPSQALPAYEDAWYHLWRERRLPINTDPHDSKLTDEVERKRLAEIFDQGLAAVVGYALPLRRAFEQERGRWESGRWLLRRERIYLLPGDSPMGWRLPVDSLPWAPPDLDHPPLDGGDPFAPRSSLPSRDQLAGRVMPQSVGYSTAFEKPSWQPNGRGQPASEVVRTAFCVQPRHGTLHLFMPPLDFVEDYLELCAAIEETASRLSQPVRIEGYHPPSDPRLGRFQITPDPGVIEVNIQPANNWDELSSNVHVLYGEARRVGLRPEKFMMDGRHSGTGGGNHIVLGGPTPSDSPLLRRPDLLRSLASYWINHPSLSYLFSGLFVGPTSQAPRVDEARHDSLYELEIAFAELDAWAQPPARDRRGEPGEKVVERGDKPWLVDRTFRNLLVDVTGNTHRTEFCIDKLFSPDAASGRQGLLELRSFEMPPHARMNLAEQLLVRGLVAMFWQSPYRTSVVKWGTDLHDRFALPHFVREDFHDVLDDLERAGFAFDPDWFQPHFEFRFPLLGSVEARPGLVLELRQAIEPWHVLGEETTTSGTTRYVDSSLDRLEVHMRGVVDGRHVVACNGRRVPLQSTGTNGTQVAGVRYRAWCPPAALHPTIAIHAPLVFDVIDSWNSRAIAGCRYHVGHPGGLAVSAFPRNGFEAEGRRAARFWAFGHSPGVRSTPPLEPNDKFPFTLDLRRRRGSVD